MENWKEKYYMKLTIWSFVAITFLTLSNCASTMHGTAQVPEYKSCALPFTVPSEVNEVRIVMMGDLHGTYEAPELAAELACTIAQNSTPVTLAIEMPHDEQAGLDAYLLSDGGDSAQRELLRSPFWQLRRDGLNTVATLGMIDRIRELSQRGALLTILAIDASSSDFERSVPNITPEHEQRVRTTMKDLGIDDEQQIQIIEKLPMLIVRERAMAQYMIEAMKEEPARHFVVFLGNGHTSKVADVPIPGRPSMASVLLSQDKTLLSLNTMAVKYTFWGCLSEQNCGLQEFEVPTPLREALIDRGKGVHMGYVGQGPPGSYDGSIIFLNTTPAKPAVDEISP